MLYPLTFYPIFKERIWGGRNLERLYAKSLPPSVPIGESWEISDRPGDESVIANGPLAGKSIRWLMVNHRDELLGNARPASSGRFPLLIKILDAQQKLSLQVHPPAEKAAELGGEPKTEMWFVANATPEADLFVGLKRGTTREEFQNRITDGTVAECFHRISVSEGDSMFLPSGRVHALGAGNVIFEIQQNSDTTYRVFDWNRLDSEGKPRDLHVEKSLASIDFNDIEPDLSDATVVEKNGVHFRKLVRDSLFSVDLIEASRLENFALPPSRMQILSVLKGELIVSEKGNEIKLRGGQFCLVPAVCENVVLRAPAPVSFLSTTAG